MSALMQKSSFFIFAGLDELSGARVGDFWPGSVGTISEKGDGLDLLDG